MVKAALPDVLIFYDDGPLGTCKEAFLRWFDANPDGLYLNWSKKVRIYLLHRTAKCPHTWKPDEGSMTTEPKICSIEVNALERWAEEQSVPWRWCDSCRAK